MRHIARIFLKTQGGKPYLLLGCLLLASVAESVGLATVLPLLTAVTGEQSGSPVQAVVRQVFATLHLPLAVGPLLLVVVGCLVVKELLNLVVQYYVSSAFANVITVLRKQLVGNLLAVEWSYVLRHPLGRFTNAASQQAKSSGDAFQAAALFVSFSVQTAVLVAASVFVSWKLTLGAIALGAFATLSVRRFVRTARRSGRQQTVRTRELVTFFSDTISNIKPLKAMARMEAFAALFEPKIEAIRKASRRQSFSKESMKSAQGIISAVVLGAGFYLTFVHMGFAVSDIIVVGLFMSASVKNLNKLLSQYQMAVTLEPAYREFTDLLNETKARAEPNPGTITATFRHGCSFQQVTFGYGERTVLDDVSLDIPAGRVTVLVGPSGSGKTTFVDLLLGLYRPNSGRILIDGVPLSELDLRTWRRMIGYVPQDLVLFHDTVFRNITLGDATISREQVEAALALSGAAGFVDNLPAGLDTVVGERGGRLSGGQRQRVALARALVIEPKLLILDEVTSALDPNTERAICDNIASLHGIKPDTTVLAITHRPAFLDLADHVYRIADGRLTAAGAGHVA
jgi:ATP-binding cassette subfamily C protein